MTGSYFITRAPYVSPYLEDTIEKSNSTGCSLVDYYTLYKHIITYRPSYILELGCGISTVVLAGATKFVHKKYGTKPQLISMEQSHEWHDELNKIFPNELRDYVNLIRSDVADEEISGMIGRHYVDTPNLPYEFVFIDGPVLDKRPSGYQFDSDLYHVACQAEQSIFSFIDGRQSTVDAYRKLFPLATMRRHPYNLGFMELRLGKSQYKLTCSSIQSQ